jgi:hypothetical protein
LADLIRTHITLARADADAAIGEDLDVDIEIGPARPGTDFAGRLCKRYLPDLQRRTLSHH